MQGLAEMLPFPPDILNPDGCRFRDVGQMLFDFGIKKRWRERNDNA